MNLKQDEVNVLTEQLRKIVEDMTRIESMPKKVHKHNYVECKRHAIHTKRTIDKIIKIINRVQTDKEKLAWLSEQEIQRLLDDKAWHDDCKDIVKQIVKEAPKPIVTQKVEVVEETEQFIMFRSICKHEHPGCRDNVCEPTCRHKDNKPKGRSWGECIESKCPLYKEFGISAKEKSRLNKLEWEESARLGHLQDGR